MTWLLGVIVVIFIGYLGDHVRLFDHNHRDVERTLWLKHLPVRDHQTWQPFLLDDSHLKRVEDDLSFALNTKLSRWMNGEAESHGARRPFHHIFKPAQWLSLPPTPEHHGSPRPRMQDFIECIHVAPVVDQWHDVSNGLRIARERKAAYELLVQEGQEEGFSCKSLWYRFQSRTYASRVKKLEQRLAQIESGPKRMSGSAFATFTDRKYQRYMLERPPGCCALLRSYTFFSFGRPPFASVTLRCMEAAHPSDVNWQNLHISTMEQNLRFLLASGLVVIIMILLVTPVAITSQLNYIIPMLKKRASDIEKWLGCSQLQIEEFAFWGVLPNQLPTVLVLCINTVVLPSAIAWISNIRRDHRHSSSEVVQMHLNLFFLILNTVIIPVLGLTSTSALLEWSREQLAVPDLSRHALLELWQTLSGAVGKQVFRVTGVFSFRYLLN